MANFDVLLLRNPSQGSPDRYHECLQSLGFVPHSIPVLDTVFTSLELIEEVLLNNSSDYDGVIITSSRAAEAWGIVVEKLIQAATDHAKWSNVPFYVVGSTTSEALKSIPPSSYTPLPENVRGSESGSGESLAWFIIDDLTGSGHQKKKLLYLTGDKNRDTLPNMLKQAGMKLASFEVYETRGSPSFRDDLNILVRSRPSFDPSKWWVVFFAPSSADFVVPSLREHFALPPNGSESGGLSPKIAAIGPTTSTHLVDVLNIKVDVISPKPTPEALGNALLP